MKNLGGKYWTLGTTVQNKNKWIVLHKLFEVILWVLFFSESQRAFYLPPLSPLYNHGVVLANMQFVTLTSKL